MTCLRNNTYFSRYPGLLLVVSLTCCLAACRLVIIVPLGGQVISLSGGYCAEDETCEIEVNDTTFEETYLVVEDAGYRFVGWARGGDRPHLCGGNTRPCALSTTNFGGNASLLNILASDDAYLLEPVFEGRLPNQRVAITPEFPQQFVNNGRNSGFFVTSLFGDAEGWIVVMTNRSKLSRQVLLNDSRFPRDAIMREMDAGLNITSLGYSNNTWVVVMSDSGHTNQRWISRSSFPASEIGAALNNGEFITNIAYGDTGQWIVVFANAPGYEEGEQRYQAAIEFNPSFVSSMWDEARDISFMTFGLDQWVTVMTGVTGNINQSWRIRDTVAEIDALIPDLRDRRRLISNYFRGGDGAYHLVATEYMDHMRGLKD